MHSWACMWSQLMAWHAHSIGAHAGLGSSQLKPPSLCSHPHIVPMGKSSLVLVESNQGNTVLRTECDKNQQYLISTSNIFSGSFKCLMNCRVKENSFMLLKDSVNTA